MKRERSMPESKQTRTIRSGLLLSLCMIALQAGSASAQLPSASPAVLGTGNNYTALARGFTAFDATHFPPLQARPLLCPTIRLPA